MIIYRKLIVMSYTHTHKTWNIRVFLSHFKDFLDLNPFFLDPDPYRFCLYPDPYQSSPWIRVRIRNEFFHILDPDPLQKRSSVRMHGNFENRKPKAKVIQDFLKIRQQLLYLVICT